MGTLVRLLSPKRLSWGILAVVLLSLVAFRPVEEVELHSAPFYRQSLGNLRQAVPGYPAVSGAPLLAGAARVEIAPPVEWDVPLGGNRHLAVQRASGKHPESVFARSIALRDGDRRLVLTSADILVVNRALAARTLELIQRRIPLASHEFFPVATHTHAGPGGYWEGFLPEQTLGPFQQRLFDYLAAALAESAIRAWESLKPVRVLTDSIPLPDLVRNRAHPAGPENPDLVLVRFEGANEPFTIDLLNYAAHPTLLLRDNERLSGDYPGRLSRLLESETHTVVFTPGTIGDQRPVVRAASADAEATDMARRLLMGWKRLRPEPLASPPALVSFEFEVRLPPVQLRGLRLGALGAWRLRESAAELVLPHDLRSTVVQVVRLGPVLLLGAPCDLATSVAAPILDRARREGFVPIVLSTSEDWIGYVMTAEEYRAERYKSYSQMHGAVSGPLFGSLYSALIDELASD